MPLVEFVTLVECGRFHRHHLKATAATATKEGTLNHGQHRRECKLIMILHFEINNLISGVFQKQVKARPKHILHLSAEERRRFLDSFDSVYSDIDGVVWDMKHRVPQAAEGLKALQRAGKTVTFLSNNSVRKMEDTVQQFEKIGLEVTPEQIWHPAKTTVHYLNSIQFKGVIYIIASPHFKAHLREAGYEMIDGVSESV